mgnify:CR=1 FL=1
MIDISDPLPGSKPGYKTLHDILKDGKRIGYVEAGYLTAEDVKTFKRSKRRLSVGQPFGVQLFLDVPNGGVSAKDLGSDGLRGVVDAVRKKLAGLEERDIYVIELLPTGRNLLGRASSL